MKYIDTDKLKAEVKIIQQSLENRDVYGNQVKKIRTECMVEFCKCIIDVIDSIQHEQPEVVLNEKKRGGVILSILKHFYKLGLNTKKEK